MKLEHEKLTELPLYWLSAGHIYIIYTWSKKHDQRASFGLFSIQFYYTLYNIDPLSWETDVQVQPFTFFSLLVNLIWKLKYLDIVQTGCHSRAKFLNFWQDKPGLCWPVLWEGRYRITYASFVRTRRVCMPKSSTTDVERYRFANL